MTVCPSLGVVLAGVVSLWASSALAQVDSGATPPSVLAKVDPKYTPEAAKAKVTGILRLSLIVDTQGLARDVRVVKPLGFGLDEKGIEAVQKWKFKPGVKDGHPVDVRATIEVTFSNPPDILSAAAMGDLEMVKALVEGNPDLANAQGLFTQTLQINGVDADRTKGFTPLLYAAQEGHRDVAEFLIGKGADINAQNALGDTPLHQAILFKHKDVAELLVASKADVNAKDRVGRTPLHMAASNGYTDIAELLLTKGADVNARDVSAGTPLHYAAKEGRKDMAELLLTKGADVNAKDNKGETPLRDAAQGHKDLVELLRQHGGRK